MSSKGNYGFFGKKMGSIKSSFYVSLSVFSRLAVLVGLFLSCLKTESSETLSQSNSNCRISKEDVICIVESTLFTFYFSGLADRAANLPPITFVSPCTFPPQMPGSCWAIAEAVPSRRIAVNLFPCPGGAKGQVWQNPLGAVTQVREKCWERGSILILY